MKKLLLVMFIFGALSSQSYSQGTVIFGNTSTTPVTMNGIAVTSAQGAKVELLWAPAGTTDLNLFQVAGAAVSVGTTVAGRFLGGTRTVGYTNDGNHGGIYALVVRAYIGPFWESSTTRAYSSIFTLDTGDPTSIPAGTATALTASGGFTGLEFFQDPPYFIVQPVSQAAPGHSAVTLHASVYGSPPPSVQWYFNGGLLSGATSPDLNIPDLWTNNLGSYYLVASNIFATATSSVAQVFMSPTIITPYLGGTAIWGRETTLSVNAIGSGTLSYQWSFNGSVIDGATNASYYLSSVNLTNDGFYSVVVSSLYGSVTNTPYQLIVYPAEVQIGLRASLTIGGAVGNTYEIQYTTDLSNTNAWTTATNLTLSTAVETWVDTESDVRDRPRRFYRVLPH